MLAYTDYPIVELGDISRQKAPIRKVKIISFDGNKYCKVKVEGIIKEIKAGYLYSEPGALGEVPVIDYRNLPIAC